MHNLEIYCTTIAYYKILEKLPSYIKPLGLGETSYPKNWLTEKTGENISSFEVESIVNEYPAIAECGAAAVPAEQGEDEVKIAVVLQPEAEFDPVELIEFLVPRMPRFAIPRYVEIWDELPKTEATARIQKAKIREARDPMDKVRQIITYGIS
mgnify:CR=1 FL=1